MGRGLVLGGSGFVGRGLVDALHWRGTSNSGKEGFLRCDATDAAALGALLREERPDVVVNCVGLADVDGAERDEALAYRLNSGVVENLVAAQLRIPFKLVQISTDYVFDGTKGDYLEQDPTSPVNAYGRSKLRGEEVALELHGSLVLRISSPYGIDFGSGKVQFFRYLVDSLRRGEVVRALSDQRVTPTYLPDLAAAVPHLLDRDAAGLYHIAGPESMTRYQFAREVARAGQLDPRLVHPATVEAMHQWVAKRPLDTSLNVGKSRAAGVRYTPAAEAINALLARSAPPGRS